MIVRAPAVLVLAGGHETNSQLRSRSPRRNVARVTRRGCRSRPGQLHGPELECTEETGPCQPGRGGRRVGRWPPAGWLPNVIVEGPAYHTPGYGPIDLKLQADVA